MNFGSEGTKKNRYDWYAVKSPSWNNPHLQKDEIEEAQNTMSQNTFLQEYGAEFTTLTNAVYPEFDRKVHLIPYDYNPNYQTFCSIDFGWQNPTAAIWIQVDPLTGKCYVFDEFVESHITTEQLGYILHNRGYNISGYYCDPAGNATESNGESPVLMLKKMGINCEFKTDPTSRKITTGIELIRSKLMNALGETNLFFSKKLKRIIHDIENYRYPEQRENEPAREEPLKDGVTDHTMDALRYFFTNRFPIKSSTYSNCHW